MQLLSASSPALRERHGIDNDRCRYPDKTIMDMAGVERPGIACNVLAADAIHPRDGFRQALRNGADLTGGGVFDFQVTEDARLLRETFAALE